MTYAGFWRRAAALLIDTLILLIPSIVSHAILPVVGGVIIALLYRPFFEASEIRGTPGKIFMGMQVVTEDGRRLDFKQALLRYFLSIVSGMFLCIGYLFNLFTPKRQTFHDMMVGSVVIMNPVPPASIDWINVWVREFKAVFNIDTVPAASGATTGSSSEPSRQETSGAAPSQDALNALEQLHKLYQQGALSESEYRAKKEELLKKI